MNESSVTVSFHLAVPKEKTLHFFNLHEVGTITGENLFCAVPLKIWMMAIIEE